MSKSSYKSPWNQILPQPPKTSTSQNTKPSLTSFSGQRNTAGRITNINPSHRHFLDLTDFVTIFFLFGIFPSLPIYSKNIHNRHGETPRFKSVPFDCPCDLIGRQRNHVLLEGSRSWDQLWNHTVQHPAVILLY